MHELPIELWDLIFDRVSFSELHNIKSICKVVYSLYAAKCAEYKAIVAEAIQKLARASLIGRSRCVLTLTVSKYRDVKDYIIFHQKRQTMATRIDDDVWALIHLDGSLEDDYILCNFAGGIAYTYERPLSDVVSVIIKQDQAQFGIKHACWTPFFGNFSITLPMFQITF